MTFLGPDRDRIVVDPLERMVMATSDEAVADLSAWAALAVLDGPSGLSTSWFHDIRPDATSRDSALYDPGDLDGKPSDAVLWNWMSAAATDGDSPLGGVGSVLTVGPFDLPRGARPEVVVAWFLGDTETEIREALRAARLAWTEWSVPAEQLAGSTVEFLPTAPNPIVTEAWVRFRLPVAGPVRLRVLDARGREVRQLLSGALGAGVHRVRWVGVDGRGQRVSRGVYRLLLETPVGDRSQPVVWWGN